MPTKVLKHLVDQVRSWPRADQLELADYARVIEARRSGRYVLSPDERTAVEEGLGEADRNEFIDEVTIPWSDPRHDA